MKLKISVKGDVWHVVKDEVREDKEHIKFEVGYIFDRHEHLLIWEGCFRPVSVAIPLGAWADFKNAVDQAIIKYEAIKELDPLKSLRQYERIK